MPEWACARKRQGAAIAHQDLRATHANACRVRLGAADMGAARLSPAALAIILAIAHDSDCDCAATVQCVNLLNAHREGERLPRSLFPRGKVQYDHIHDIRYSVHSKEDAAAAATHLV